MRIFYLYFRLKSNAIIVMMIMIIIIIEQIPLQSTEVEENIDWKTQ